MAIIRIRIRKRTTPNWCSTTNRCTSKIEQKHWMHWMRCRNWNADTISKRRFSSRLLWYVHGWHTLRGVYCWSFSITHIWYGLFGIEKKVKRQTDIAASVCISISTTTTNNNIFVFLLISSSSSVLCTFLVSFVRCAAAVLFVSARKIDIHSWHSDRVMLFANANYRMCDAYSALGLV